MLQAQSFFKPEAMNSQSNPNLERSSSSRLGNFSKRFEILQTLYKDPGFTWCFAKDSQEGHRVRLQRLELHTGLKPCALQEQWRALKACGKSLWVRPQEFLEAKATDPHGGLLLTWVPPGRPFSQTKDIQSDEVYLKWLSQALCDLREIHQQGLLHLAQNENSWILFKPDESSDEEQLGLSDIGLLTEVPFGRPLRVENALALAPEILRGGPLGPATDLYALACLILKQRAPHQWENLKRLDQVLRVHWDGRLSDWVPKSETKLHRILRKMLAADPQERPQDTEELLAELEDKERSSKGNTFSRLKEDWSRRRHQSRQNTLRLHALATLLEFSTQRMDFQEDNAVYQDLASEILASMESAGPEKLTGSLQAHVLYLKSKLKYLQGELKDTTKFRQQALNLAYDNSDSPLKTFLWLEEALVRELEDQTDQNKKEGQGESGEAVLKALENAWESAQSYPDPLLKRQVLWEQAPRLKAKGSDEVALQKLHQAWQEPENSENLLENILVPSMLGELLTNYGVSSGKQLLDQACELLTVLSVECQSISKPDLKSFIRTCLQVASGSQDLETREGFFAKARDLVRKEKNLTQLLWVEAHHVRSLLEAQDWEQARRELKALNRRNLEAVPQEFLDFLELELWIKTGEKLWSHDTRWEERLEEYLQKNQKGAVFCELAWPPFRTFQLLAKYLEKKQRFGEAESWYAKAKAQRDSVEQILKALDYPVGKTSSFSVNRLSSKSIQVESLLHPFEAMSQAKTSAKPRGVPEDSIEEKKEISALEKLAKELENEREIWEGEKSVLQKEIEQLKEELAQAKKQKVKPTQVKDKVQATPALEKPSLSQRAESTDEKTQILAVLKQHQGHRSRTAKQLGIHRRTLLEKLKKYDLENIDFLPSKEELEKALAENQGKKSAAAQQLGLSRASFYRRLKEFGLG